jgi:hypothetical protein
MFLQITELGTHFFLGFVLSLSRSSNFQARNFVLLRLDSARTGQPGQDRQNKTALTDSQDMKART